MNEKTPEPEEKSLFQLDNQYVVRPVRNGIADLLTKTQFHQQICLNNFVQRMQQKSGQAFRLVPQTITMSASDFALVYGNGTESVAGLSV